MVTVSCPEQELVVKGEVVRADETLRDSLQLNPRVSSLLDGFLLTSPSPLSLDEDNPNNNSSLLNLLLTGEEFFRSIIPSNTPLAGAVGFWLGTLGGAPRQVFPLLPVNLMRVFGVTPNGIGWELGCLGDENGEGPPVWQIKNAHVLDTWPSIVYRDPQSIQVGQAPISRYCKINCVNLY